VFALLLLAAACDVTPEKIARWKETQHGPEKLRDAVASSSVKADVRAQAFVALCEIRMSTDAVTTLGKAPEAERAAVVHEAVPRLASLAAGAGASAPTTTHAQREAKDALFLVRAWAQPADRTAIDDQLIAWTTTDLAGRMTAGGQGSEKILITIGARAAPRLVQLLELDGATQQLAASILVRIADVPTQARAVDALIARAQQVAARTNDVPDTMLQSIALLGGPHASAYLAGLADHGRESLREHALLALAQGSLAANDGIALDAAVRIAADKNAPGKVREAAFQLGEKLGAQAVPRLLKLLDDGDETVRWRAVEAVLAAGKDKAVAPVLEALSQTRAYKREDIDSYVVHDLALVGASALPALKQELESKSWVAQVSAVRALAVIGHAPDAPAVEALAASTTKLKGFPASATLGSEARAAAAALRAKK
jgi:HEAT repeats